MDKIPELKKSIYEHAVCSKETIDYIWDTAISVQMGWDKNALKSFSSLSTRVLLYTFNGTVYMTMLTGKPHQIKLGVIPWEAYLLR